MGEHKKNISAPIRETVKFYKKEIVDIVDKIENEQFLKRIYISLRDYAKENGLD